MSEGGVDVQPAPQPVDVPASDAPTLPDLGVLQVDPRPRDQAREPQPALSDEITEDLTPTEATMTNAGRRRSALFTNIALTGVIFTAAGLAHGNIPMAIGGGMVTAGALRIAAQKQ